MTERLQSGIRQAWQRSCRDGDKPIPTPGVIPAQAGIHEGGPGSAGVAGFVGWRVRLSLLWLSFLLCGNGLFQPLDSSLRWNDGGGDDSLRRATTGVLGGPFLTPLYRGSAELAERPASMQACP